VRTSGHGQSPDIDIRVLYQHDFVLPSCTIIHGLYVVSTDCVLRYTTIILELYILTIDVFLTTAILAVI